MLVKLGKVWVDPHEVVFMEQDLSIITTHGSTRAEEGNIDDFAAIINTALTTQTFGGTEDEKENPVA